MNSLALLRYNFRVMMFRNWWLLVIPLAVSQLTVFWCMTTQQVGAGLPELSVERISPLLAAFLSAHLLAAEYRSGIGAIVASKPIDVTKVVLMRLAVVLALVWVLGLLSLYAFYYGMEPYDIRRPALAGIPSTLFMALLALTFATLLRNPLAGFAVAAAYWVLDLPPGPALNPFLTLRSLGASILPQGTPAGQLLIEPWWIAKAILLAAALALYFYHVRLLFTLGSPITVRRRRRTIACAAGLVLVYVVTGAAFKVGYGFAHRGNLEPDDTTWFRKEFASYGPVPMASLFGSAFAAYIGEIPNTWSPSNEGDPEALGDTPKHETQLREILSLNPRNPWAPSAAALLAQMVVPKQATIEQKIAYYHTIIEKYPQSPYVATALRGIARVYADADMVAEARSAFQDLQKQRPGSRFSVEARRYLQQTESHQQEIPNDIKAAQQKLAVATPQEKFTLLVRLAMLYKDSGQTEQSRQAAGQAIEAVKVYRRLRAAGALITLGARERTYDQNAAMADAQARQLLGKQ